MSTDSEIIRRAERTPAAFAEVFDRHAPTVEGFLRRRLGADASEDALSETFLIAFRRRTSFDHTWENARPWLLGIASRVAKRHRAIEAKQWRAIRSAADRGEFTSGGGIDEVTEHLDAAAVVRRLVPRITALSAADRETLLLVAWGNLTQVEVAQALGIPEGTVASRMNRIRRKLTPADANRASAVSMIGEEYDDGRLGARA